MTRWQYRAVVVVSIVKELSILLTIFTVGYARIKWKYADFREARFRDIDEEKSSKEDDSRLQDNTTRIQDMRTMQSHGPGSMSNNTKIRK